MAAEYYTAAEDHGTHVRISIFRAVGRVGADGYASRKHDIEVEARNTTRANAVAELALVREQCAAWNSGRCN